MCEWNVFVYLTLYWTDVSVWYVQKESIHLTHFYSIENPCNHHNPCLNNGTCFGRYNANETLSTDCLCSEGFTGNHCEGNDEEDLM